MFLPHFDVICDLLLNRRTATWNLFVNYIAKYVIKYDDDDDDNDADDNDAADDDDHGHDGIIFQSL